MSRTKIEKNIAWDDVKECYYVTLYFGKGTDGKVRKSYKTATSKKEAQRLLKEHNKKMEAGSVVFPVKTTLAGFLEEFIEYKALSLSETTIYGYRNILKNHIIPYFKNMTVQEITTKDIQNYVTVKAKTGISLQTIKKHVALLDSVFRNAYMSRIIDENPVSRLEHIKAPSHKLECMDAHEIALLCDSVEGTQLEVPVKLAVYLGLRRGEVLGLKWEHIDFKNAVLYVNNTRTQAGRNTIEKQPKTERSIRQLHLSQELIDLLVEQKKKSSRIMVKNQAMTDYVAFMDNGRPFKPNYLSECFRNHLLSNGYKPIRFHDLRHSFASIANDAGISMNEISSAMGHSNISTTSEIYTHEFSKTKTKAVNAVSQCISQAKTIGNTYNNSTP